MFNVCLITFRLSYVFLLRDSESYKSFICNLLLLWGHPVDVVVSYGRWVYSVIFWSGLSLLVGLFFWRSRLYKLFICFFLRYCYFFLPITFFLITAFPIFKLCSFLIMISHLFGRTGRLESAEVGKNFSLLDRVYFQSRTLAKPFYLEARPVPWRVL